MSKFTMPKRAFLGVLVGALVLLCLGSLVVGSLSLQELWRSPALGMLVMMDVRLPRTLLALITGMALGGTGAVLQGFLRNPLVDPGVMGIAAAAACGAVIALVLGCAWFGVYTAPLFGVAGAIFLTTFLYVILQRMPSTLTLILVGMAVNSFLGALIALILNLSTNPYANLEILFWLMGSFENYTLGHVLPILPLVFLGGALLWATRPTLDDLALGEDMAIALGHSPRKSYRSIILGTALVIGPVVSLVGTVGFVGLVVPHLMRPWTDHRPSQLFWPSALGGGALTLVADIIVRSLSTGIDIKIGVVTALIGAPFFLSLLTRK